MRGLLVFGMLCGLAVMLYGFGLFEIPRWPEPEKPPPEITVVRVTWQGKR